MGYAHNGNVKPCAFRTPYEVSRAMPLITIDLQALTAQLAARGWTNADLARASGVAASTLTSVFAGKPTAARTLRAIAQAFAATPALPGAEGLVSHGSRLARP
jgi:lambda repressor-like predicted transcriptional regulator